MTTDSVTTDSMTTDSVTTGTNFYLAIDIGAGHGTRIVLCTAPDAIGDANAVDAVNAVNAAHAACEFPVARYGATWEEYLAGLTSRIDMLLQEASTSGPLLSIGVATAGILHRDGSFLLVRNIPFLTGHNLKAALQERYAVPVGIDNDATAGALAEWNEHRQELLYWVFGGGWGGAWISREGEVRYPTTGWDGADSSLHPTAEPGFSIALEKHTLRELFNESNAEFDRFLENLLYEYLGDVRCITGPGGDTSSLRAETILSGPGRERLYRVIASTPGEIPGEDRTDLPAVTGEQITLRSEQGEEPALQTDRLFGKILAHAAGTLLKRAESDGLPRETPIFLGGKPSRAMPWFGPSAEDQLRRWGWGRGRGWGAGYQENLLRWSVVDERGVNANLSGAVVMAIKGAERRRTGVLPG